MGNEDKQKEKKERNEERKQEEERCGNKMRHRKTGRNW